MAVWPSAPLKTIVANSPQDTTVNSLTGNVGRTSALNLDSESSSKLTPLLPGKQLSEDISEGCNNFQDREFEALVDEFNLSDPNSYPSQYFTAIKPTEITTNDIPIINSDDIPQYTDLQPLGATIPDAELAKLILQPQDLLLTTQEQCQVDSIISQNSNNCKIFYINKEIKLDKNQVVTLDDIYDADQQTNPNTSLSPVQQVPKSPLHSSSPVHEPQYASHLLKVTNQMSPEHTVPCSPQNVTSPIHEPQYVTSPSHLTQYSALPESMYILPESVHDSMPYNLGPPRNAKENIDPGDTLTLTQLSAINPPENCLYDAVPLKCAKENVDPGDNAKCINITSENVLMTGVLHTTVNDDHAEIPSIHLEDLSFGSSDNAFDELFERLLDKPAAYGDCESDEAAEFNTSNKRKRSSTKISRESDVEHQQSSKRSYKVENQDETEEQVPVKKKRNRSSKPQSQEKKDDIRIRNNTASRIYRSNKKNKIQTMTCELQELKEKNAQLQAAAETAEGQVEIMKKLVYKLYNVGGKK